PAPGADIVFSSVEQLAVVNHGVEDPVAISTQVVNAAGDKLDFNGAHFFGRDQEQHDFNRQAHVNLELVRNVDPHLRRFLGKSIVKREGPYPPAVWPPTHYEPPTSPPPVTTTTTEAPPTTTPPVVPHEVYGLPSGEPVPVPCVPKTWGEGPDCVPTELFPPPPVVDLPVVDLPVVDLPVVDLPGVPPLVLCSGEDESGNNLQEPAKTTLYELNEIVGNLFEVEEQEAPGTNGDTPPSDGLSACTDCTVSQPPELPEPTDTDGNTPPSEALSGCTDCTVPQLPELPALVYPSLPPSPPTATVPPPPAEPQVPDCQRTVFVKTYPGTEPFQIDEKTAPREQHDEAVFVDLRRVEDKKQKSNVLSTQSQVILVRD
uniref:Uncharacterized protein n=1 Tax=Anopheles atroparvus TaxID=41427 RepID=A0AAG5DEB2_ANOAO